MFFSVIIPTYNPKKYLNNILESITKSDCKDNIEVIISDDCSTEDFSDITNDYSAKLNIVKIQNEQHYGAPMRGRQHGAEVANGEWICFADQDDYFTDHAFDYVKECIEKEKAHNYLITDFYEKSEDGDMKEMIHTLNWTHGKFYQRTFWKDYGIKYPITKYCEDIGLSVLIACIMAENELDEYYFPCFTYTWVGHEDSLSRQNGISDSGYFYKSLPDYIRITLGVYVNNLNKCEKAENNVGFYANNILDMFYHLFFYYQGMLWNNVNFEKEMQEYIKLSALYFKEFLQIMGWTKEIFIDVTNQKYERFKEVRDICYGQVPFIEKISFYEWIDKIESEVTI